MSQLLKALSIVPNLPETRSLQNTRVNKRADISRTLRVNSFLKLARRGACPSQLDQFDSLVRDDMMNVVVNGEHKREFMSIKSGDAVKQWKPQGTLTTTLYGHTSPVNTVTVTDDEQFFMTGSREEKRIHVWKMQNIENDVSGHSIH